MAEARKLTRLEDSRRGSFNAMSHLRNRSPEGAIHPEARQRSACQGYDDVDQLFESHVLGVCVPSN
jgi:hypothetical protein